MAEWLAQHELGIRLAAFGAVFALMAAWEVRAPRRRLTRSKPQRWGNNLALVALDSVVARLVFPAGAVGAALFAEQQGWGLLRLVEWPLLFEGLLAIVALDFVIWTQHVLVHAVPALWRLHRVHHADPDYDLTTGARFHPLEILLSFAVKSGAILLLGPAATTVLIFEVLLNATSMFNHGNIRLPPALDRHLRLVLVTPDMHRVHHSVDDDETNSNFGFNLSCWDLLFGTYRAQPRHGHVDMVIGIRDYTQPAAVTWLPGMLLLPFRGRIDGYAINRRPWPAEDTQS